MNKQIIKYNFINSLVFWFIFNEISWTYTTLSFLPLYDYVFCSVVDSFLLIRLVNLISRILCIPNVYLHIHRPIYTHPHWLCCLLDNQVHATNVSKRKGCCDGNCSTQFLQYISKWFTSITYVEKLALHKAVSHSALNRMQTASQRASVLAV